MFERVLVPLDGSHLAEAVLPAVQHLARAWNSTVVLLHVLERGAPTAVHGDRHLTAVPEAQRYLESIAARLHDRGIRVEQHAHEAPEGDVARSIAMHAEEVGAELTALCTHGKGRMHERIFGSIAQKVLSFGVTAVLLVRPPVNGQPRPFDPRRVLVPLDGSPGSEAAVGPAVLVARALGASVHLIRVVPTLETMRGDQAVAATFLPSSTRAALDLEEEDANRYLATIGGTAGSSKLDISVEVPRGDPASVLITKSAGRDVGLVVLTTHGRAGLQATWAGSVAAQLLAHTETPVLLLRRTDQRSQAHSKTQT